MFGKVSQRASGKIRLDFTVAFGGLFCFYSSCSVALFVVMGWVTALKNDYNLNDSMMCHCFLFLNPQRKTNLELGLTMPLEGGVWSTLPSCFIWTSSEHWSLLRATHRWQPHGCEEKFPLPTRTARDSRVNFQMPVLLVTIRPESFVKNEVPRYHRGMGTALVIAWLKRYIWSSFLVPEQLLRPLEFPG